MMLIPQPLRTMLEGGKGPAAQMAARLIIDLANVAKVSDFVEVDEAHVSGVSVLTGGYGLRRFLSELTSDINAEVAIPTTLNAAGCDHEQMKEMNIVVPDFLKLQFEIIHAYESLGIYATLSCTPYDRGNQIESSLGAWAESNAVCYANTYSNLITNRESGLSALATALTGWAPKWGLHLKENRKPNMVIHVDCKLEEPTEWSVLGDWISTCMSPELNFPYGPMPLFKGLPVDASFEMKKALTAAAANHGCPMLWIDGITSDPPPLGRIPEIHFTEKCLERRLDELSPTGTVDLIVIGCPQASIGEVRATAAHVRARMELGFQIQNQRLWVFTSAFNYEQLEEEGTVALLTEAGAIVLKDTCPEVTPYNRKKYNHLLTNSMKAEHYLTSGLNRLPTSVARLKDCVAHAFEPSLAHGKQPTLEDRKKELSPTSKTDRQGPCTLEGRSISSQKIWKVRGEALVTDVPLTWLGHVNRETGIIEDESHPLNGHQIDGKVLIHPRGSGSTVAPYVLMGLAYVNRGPLAIISRDVCPLVLPACSLLKIPYAHGFSADPCLEINNGDLIEMRLIKEKVILEVIERVYDRGIHQ